jgi:AraC-like DNA-binding protein
MPIFMDIHQVPGIEALDAAEAHRKDILIQDEYHCKCLTYWIDEARGVAFCLIEAPDDQIVAELHKNSHGLIPSKIIEVENGIVESFLGRIHDPQGVKPSDNGLKVFSDSAFRILITTEIIDPILLRFKLGEAKANEILHRQEIIIKDKLSHHHGRMVESAGSRYILSFTTADQAVACAIAIQDSLSQKDKGLSGFTMAINGGEPVRKSNTLFGDTIKLARNLCTIKNNHKIVVSTVVKELLSSGYYQQVKNGILTLAPQDEMLVESLFDMLEDKWQDASFDVKAFCQSMSMSKSQLYRKTVALWGLPPNSILKEFRLDKARDLLKRHSNNISQTTFDSGFNSPSYFTKCFKKKFGLLPAMYLNSLS